MTVYGMCWSTSMHTGMRQCELCSDCMHPTGPTNNGDGPELFALGLVDGHQVHAPCLISSLHDVQHTQAMVIYRTAAAPAQPQARPQYPEVLTHLGSVFYKVSLALAFSMPHKHLKC
jgi:hypothetical protein